MGERESKALISARRFTLVSVIVLSLHFTLAWPIDAYLISAFGVRADSKYDQVFSILVSQGFRYRRQPSSVIPDATNVTFSKGKDDFVRILVLNPTTILSIFPSQILYRGKRLRVGDPSDRCREIFGPPDRVTGNELTYRDNTHMVPVLVTVKDDRIILIELAPGPDQYESQFHFENKARAQARTPKAERWAGTHFS